MERHECSKQLSSTKQTTFSGTSIQEQYHDVSLCAHSSCNRFTSSNSSCHGHVPKPERCRLYPYLLYRYTISRCCIDICCYDITLQSHATVMDESSIVFGVDHIAYPFITMPNTKFDSSRQPMLWLYMMGVASWVQYSYSIMHGGEYKTRAALNRVTKFNHMTWHPPEIHWDSLWQSLCHAIEEQTPTDTNGPYYTVAAVLLAIVSNMSDQYDNPVPVRDSDQLQCYLYMHRNQYKASAVFYGRKDGLCALDHTRNWPSDYLEYNERQGLATHEHEIHIERRSIINNEMESKHLYGYIPAPPAIICIAYFPRYYRKIMKTSSFHSWF